MNYEMELSDCEDDELKNIKDFKNTYIENYKK